MSTRARVAVLVLVAVALGTPPLVAGSAPEAGCSTMPPLSVPGPFAAAGAGSPRVHAGSARTAGTYGLEVAPGGPIATSGSARASADGAAPPGAAPRRAAEAPVVAGAASAPNRPGTAPARAAAPAQDWREIDSTSGRMLIPAGKRWLVRFDSKAGRLVEERPIDRLGGPAQEAVARAPSWVADALADNLARLPADRQEALARLILDAPDPIVDEVAFQVARLGIGPLTDRRFDPSLLVDNARLMYEHDKVLQYVQIVDTGSAEEGGDYYSTTRYQVGRPGDPAATSWVEVPRDVYYWFVVHPKLSDETVKDSREADSQQATYGYHWREYLFANPNPGYDYSRGADGAGAYPVLGQVLARPTVLWDGVAADLPGGRPFGPTDTALDVVGNWVSTMLPERASGNRPVQPNQIAFEHNGNCGEIQDLLGAASRTALIPNVLTSNHCEDHVWNEVFVAGPEPHRGWIPYQVDWAQGPTRIDRDNIAYDKDRGGAKDDSGIWAWRSDGFAYDVVDRYSNACSLVIRVQTADGKPVDGARVVVFSESWGDDSRFYPATFGHTDATGTARFRVGDAQNYYLQVTSTLGDYPPERGRIVRMVENTAIGETYTATVNVPGTLRRYADRVEPAASAVYRLAVRYRATDEVVYGASPFGEALDFTEWLGTGQIDFVVFDQANFAVYDGGGAATANAAAENSASGEAIVPAGDDDSGDRYVVFSNEDHVKNGQIVDAEVTLYRDAAVPTPTPKPRPAVYMPYAKRGIPWPWDCTPSPTAVVTPAP